MSDIPESPKKSPQPFIKPILEKEEPDITLFTVEFKPFTSFGFNQPEQSPKLKPKYEITENGNFKLTMVPDKLD
jgi:hypothetical protein